jgi:hypothetical protein
MPLSVAQAPHTTEFRHGVVRADTLERLARLLVGVDDLPNQLCGRELQVDSEAISDNIDVRFVPALRRARTLAFIAAALLPVVRTNPSTGGAACVGAGLPDSRLLFLPLTRGPPR